MTIHSSKSSFQDMRRLRFSQSWEMLNKTDSKSTDKTFQHKDSPSFRTFTKLCSNQANKPNNHRKVSGFLEFSRDIVHSRKKRTKISIKKTKCSKSQLKRSKKRSNISQFHLSKFKVNRKNQKWLLKRSFQAQTRWRTQTTSHRYWTSTTTDVTSSLWRTHHWRKKSFLSFILQTQVTLYEKMMIFEWIFLFYLIENY